VLIMDVIFEFLRESDSKLPSLVIHNGITKEF
jgi:hypothetical protein